MSIETWYHKIHRHPAGRISLHIALWLVFYAIQFYILQISLGTKDAATSYLVPLKNTVTTIIAFYPLVYLAWPYFSKRKYLPAIFFTLVIIFSYAISDYACERWILTSCRMCAENLREHSPVYYEYLQKDSMYVLFTRIASLGIVYQLFLMLALPVGIKFTLEYFQQRLQTLRLKHENTELELNLLKAQVNPHFLFNTLNNIYALILKDKKEESAETVARLSTFLRYSLYEGKGDISPLAREIDLLKDYTALEKIRLNQTSVDFTYDYDEPNYTLPPLLFMPVVENAFKFCVEEKGKPSWISIRLQINNHLLKFVVSNTWQEDRSAKEQGGIGLLNFIKRLEHHYPGAHSVKIKKEPSVFTLTAEINLHAHD